MRVLLVAEDAPGIQVLKALQEREHEIVAVMAKPADRSARGASVWHVAEHAGLQTWPAERVKDPALGDLLGDAAIDLLLNAYSLFVIHHRVLDAPRIGSYNLHPGPLPAYAGLNSVNWAIYHGERSHGVTVHRMDPLVDAGPIAYQETFAIESTDTGLTVSTRCIKVGVRLMIQLIDAAARDPALIPAIEQDLSMRSYFGGEIPHEGRLSWDAPARSVSDFVRACDFHPLTSPWGNPTAMIAGRELGILSVSQTGSPAGSPPGTTRTCDDGSVLVACIDEWVRVAEVIDQGRHLSAAQVMSTFEGPDEGR